MVARVRIERHVKITTQLLRRHGLLKPVEANCLIEFEHVSAFFSVDECNNNLDIEFQEELSASFSIPLDYVWLKKGRRYYLCCTRCCEKFDELHLVFGHWLCRRCSVGQISVKGPSPYERRAAKIQKGRDRLLGLDGAGPARGSNRDKIAAALLADPLTRRLYPDIIPLLRAQARREISRKRKACAQRHWPALTTEHALGLGVHVSPPRNPAGELETRFLYVDGAYAPTDPCAADNAVGIMEHHPSLDIRVLSRRWKREQNSRWAHTLVWPETFNISEMVVVAELADPAHPHLLVITQVRSMSKTIQKIAVSPVPTAGGGTRWFFICGLTNKRCELLFLRNEFFASPVAQRLVRQSQRALTQARP